MAPKIFVPQPIPEVAIEKMREYAEVAVWPWSHRAISIPELCQGVAGADYLFGWPHSMPVTASMIAANPNLKGIAVSGITTGPSNLRADTSGIAAAEAAGIPFLIAKRPTTDEPSLVGHATSDLMVAMLLDLAYRVVEADRYSRRLGYFQEMTMDLMGIGCYGMTVSLIGLGRVARGAIPALKALGLDVLYTKRTRLEKEEESELGIEWVEDRDELIARGDFVSMLASFEEANVNLMGAREFALMKPTAYFINVARGRLVDETAMIEALENGTIAGAAMDVFVDEPPVVLDARIPEALRKLDNVILTPHNGGATYASRGRAALAIADAIIEDIEARRGEG
jgi:glyoxylate reductase